MKILSDSIRFLLLLVLIGIGAISCSEDMEVNDDDAQGRYGSRKESLSIEIDRYE